MNTTRILTGALFVFGMGTAAMADAETGYTLNVSRLAGNVDCVVTNPQNEKAAFECGMKLKGNKTVGIGMKKAAPRLVGEKESGFYGTDLFGEGKVAKTFVVVADKNKAIKFVSFADVLKVEEKDIRINVSGNAASTIKAVSINPLHIVTNEAKTEVKIGVWFTLYGQDAAQVADAEKGIIPAEVMAQIQALLLQALSK